MVVKHSDRENEAEVSNLESGGSMWGVARLTPGRKNCTLSRMGCHSDAVRFRTYDEQIEGGKEQDEVAYPDNLDFEFEIP